MSNKFYLWYLYGTVQFCTSTVYVQLQEGMRYNFF